MLPQRRSPLIFGLLLGVWVLVMAWQVEEHVRVRNAARVALVNRAKDISTTLGIVLRSQRRFGGVVSKERLEASLAELAKQESVELRGIALLNAAGDMVASAGTGTDFQIKGATDATERWDSQTVTLVNPMDLGTNLTYDFEGTNPPIIMSREDFTNRLATNHISLPPPGPPHEPPPEPQTGAGPTNLADAGGAMLPPSAGSSTNGEPPRDRGFRFHFGRPPWMSVADYQALLQKQGVHSFVIVMSTESIRSISLQDLWLRAVIVLLAAISAVGSGLAWRNLSKTSELQIRLVRASEMNSHLKEMNLAAAGLAHETRNPLNIIRGMAQMLSKQTGASPEDIREKSRAIVNETDKVTAQLNEFINYSRPREIRRSKIALGSAVNEVVRALSSRHRGKENPGRDRGRTGRHRGRRTIAAAGAVQSAAQRHSGRGPRRAESRFRRAAKAPPKACWKSATTAPGCRPNAGRKFSSRISPRNQKGTGLGLAVVQQIVLAHGWEIECLANEPKGAVFRITHLKLPPG